MQHLSAPDRENLSAKLLFKSSEDARGCRLWEGGVKSGYGKVWVNIVTLEGVSFKKHVRVHRLALFLYHGPFEDLFEKEVSHLCSNKLCIQVEHLSLEPHCINIERITCVLYGICNGHMPYRDCII